VTLPSNFQLQDTLGQKFITAFEGSGYIVISKIPDKEDSKDKIYNEKQLMDAYKEFQKGFMDSQHGKLIKEAVVEKGGLKLKRFDYEIVSENSTQMRHCLILYVNKVWYAINYSELTSLLNESNPPYEKLFSSVQINPRLTAQDQLTPGAISYQIGYITGRIFVWALVVGVGVLIIFGISKLRKRFSGKRTVE